METRYINEQYAEIANKVIENEPALNDVKESEATIVYLASNKPKTAKGKTVFAECEKVADKNKWAIPADFTITVYEPNCVGMTEDQLYILLFHELLHVGIDYQDGGEEKYYIRPHDYEDFKLIIDRFGTNWSRT